jgi:2-dehydro-3-deoxygluconokinase
MKPIVTFGEIMMRLSPPGFLRFGQARSFEVIYGGGEANVAVSLANYGLPVEYITRLPANDLGDACLVYLRQYGVGTRFVARGGERLGIYFMEFGAAQRGSKVVYDRANSSISTIAKGMVDWKAVFAEAGWFHWTGITPAISAGAAEALQEALEAARSAGVTVSCDLNYRKNLWKWGKKAGEVMPDLVKLSDIAIGNEEDAEKVFGIKAEHSNVLAGKVHAEDYQKVALGLQEKFPNLKGVAITLRGSLSASHNTWSGVFQYGGRFYTAPTYDIVHIVDRVGGGDAFGGGLICGLKAKPDDPQYALNFAVAASCLKHSIYGDFNLVTKAEVETLMGGDASGRVSR